MSQSLPIDRTIPPANIRPLPDLGILADDLSPRMHRILDAALGLFAAQGFRSTTMEEIGAALDVRGPSLYKHVASKQDMLTQIMIGIMARLQSDHDQAVATSDDVIVQLHRAVEAHVRFHSRYRRESFVGNREIQSLDPEVQFEVKAMRRAYEHSFRSLVSAGIDTGVFEVRSAKLAAYTLLDMGIGVSLWFRDDGEFSIDQIAYHYADLAMRVVGR